MTAGANTPNEFPDSFPLSSLKIQLIKQPGNAADSRESITVSGSGSCARAKDPQAEETTCQNLSSEELLGLIDGLQRAQFFNLKDRFRTTREAYVDQHGNVRWSYARPLDKESWKLCVEAGGYNKCLVFQESTPAEIQAVIDQLNVLSGR